MEVQVSVIICTYNANIKKLQRTLWSALNQKGIKHEIIIADDGSVTDDFLQVELFLKHSKFDRFCFVNNKQNQGTVRNILSGLRVAKGKYVFLTSPGDMLADEYVLKDFWMFAEQNAARAVFGNGLYYYESEGKIVTPVVISSPSRPQLFCRKVPFVFQKLMVLEKDSVLGAAYFREREYLLEYIQMILKDAKYVEDTTCAMLSVVRGDKIIYYNRDIVWYEYGSGISNGGNNKWITVVEAEIQAIKKRIYEEYKSNPVVDYLQNRDLSLKRKVYCCFRHPIITMVDVWIHLLPKRFVQCNDMILMKYLKQWDAEVDDFIGKCY